MLDWWWIAISVLVVYLTRKYWNPPKKIEPSGKTILVTGAASGFGLCTTQQLLSQGCNVLAVDINYSNLEKHFANESRVSLFQCDISKTEEVEQLQSEVEEVLKMKGWSLFGLVNNAGILLPPLSILNTPEESLHKVMEINAFGMWRMTRSFLSLIEKDGAIVNVTSVAGFLTAPYNGAYSMSKHAAEAFSDALRREIKATGVRVGMVEPYFANTPLLEALKNRDAKLEGEHKEEIDRALAVTTHVRLLPPEKVARCVCESLFTSPCRTRIRVAFWYDRILLFCLSTLFTDRMADSIFNWLSSLGGKL